MTTSEVAWLLSGTAALAFVLAVTATAAVMPVATRLGFVDRPGAHKSHARITPYGGGVAIAIAVGLPATVVLLTAVLIGEDRAADWFGATVAPYVGGLVQESGRAAALLLGALLLHVLGLIDDVRPLGPRRKLLVMLTAAGLATTVGEVRLAEFAGPTVSIILSVAWIVVIINAMNFLDNMDGLSAGVAVICLAIMSGVGVLAGQVLAPLFAALCAGAIAGFLFWNFPPARIFMGDAGSLLVGYMLALVSIMTTYYQSDAGRSVYALAMPLVILAAPLYDFVTVLFIRLREGRHPMQGDQRHFSHRLVQHGLSRPMAVLTIYLATLATGLSAVFLVDATLGETLVVLGLTFSVLGIIAILESPVQRTP